MAEPPLGITKWLKPVPKEVGGWGGGVLVSPWSHDPVYDRGRSRGLGGHFKKRKTRVSSES